MFMMTTSQGFSELESAVEQGIEMLALQDLLCRFLADWEWKGLTASCQSPSALDRVSLEAVKECCEVW